jgi:hypothetical protein
MNQNTVPQRKGWGRDHTTLLRLVRARSTGGVGKTDPLTRSAAVTREAIGLIS